MSSPPAISILIPCFNAERWLAPTLESALGQTHRSTEIILVDDGSRDNSLAIARQFEARGVVVVGWPVSPSGGLFGILKTLGYAPDDVIMEKRICAL